MRISIWRLSEWVTTIEGSMTCGYVDAWVKIGNEQLGFLQTSIDRPVFRRVSRHPIRSLRIHWSIIMSILNL